MESQVNPQEAQAALASIDQSRSDIADRLVSPWWYHPVLGILAGGLGAVAGSGAGMYVLAVGPIGPIIAIGVLVVFVVGMILLARLYYRRVGVSFDEHAAGLRKRRNLAIAMSFGLVIVGNYGAIVVGFNPWSASIAAGAVIAVFTVVWGRRFDKAMRAELRESA